jgi:hypothetical protein
MGADIHMFVEKKLVDGEWATVQTFDPIGKRAVGLESKNPYDFLYFDVTQRNYQLFANLAAVRGFGPEPLGVPDDASSLYRHYAQRWSGDAHSHSWCSAATFIERYLDTCDEQSDIVKHYAKWVLDRGHNAAVLTFLDTYCAINVHDEESADDYRFVFFFDN